MSFHPTDISFLLVSPHVVSSSSIYAIQPALQALLYIASFSVLISKQLTVIYRIVQNFDGGNFDVFDAFQLDHQNLTHQTV